MKASFHTQVELANSQTMCMVHIYTVITLWERKKLCGLSVSFDLYAQYVDIFVSLHLVLFISSSKDRR